MGVRVETKSFRELSKQLGIDEKGKVQKFIDKSVRDNLMAYVSFRTGKQEQSIKTGTVLGSGEVVINVPYAEMQAYSKRIKKRDGKRGTYPFERMKADKKDSILKQTIAYANKISK